MHKTFMQSLTRREYMPDMFLCQTVLNTLYPYSEHQGNYRVFGFGVQ
jgi:hypothetical protein